MSEQNDKSWQGVETEMEGVTEYCEHMSVDLAEKASGPGSRPVIRAFNQSGYDSTEVDVRELVAWLKSNRPDLLE